MKRLSKLDFSDVRPEVIRSKRIFGLLYGVVAGITFATASWGWDGYLLSISHGYLPWTMLITGLIFCAILGAIAGWLTARSESSLLGALFWVISSFVFAWLNIALPLQINPFIVSKFDPQLGALLEYGKDVEFAFGFGVSLLWILPFMLIVGVTQLPITESAVFSTSVFGKITPFLFCIVVLSISGAITDSLINSHFRAAITSLDNTIQFVLDNKNNENTDPVLSREMHVSALKIVEEHVQESRRLFVGSYAEYFSDIHVLVKFDDQWVDCSILDGRPVVCNAIMDN